MLFDLELYQPKDLTQKKTDWSAHENSTTHLSLALLAWRYSFNVRHSSADCGKFHAKSGNFQSQKGTFIKIGQVQTTVAGGMLELLAFISEFSGESVEFGNRLCFIIGAYFLSRTMPVNYVCYTLHSWMERRGLELLKCCHHNRSWFCRRLLGYNQDLFKEKTREQKMRSIC